MNTPFFVSAPAQDATALTLHDARAAERVNQPHDIAPVGDGRLSHIGEPLTDASREEAIARAGRAIERHMEVWKREGCFAARGDADRARRLMELLIAGRSPEQVARMRAAQDERMAREPGAERTGLA